MMCPLAPLWHSWFPCPFPHLHRRHVDSHWIGKSWQPNRACVQLGGGMKSCEQKPRYVSHFPPPHTNSPKEMAGGEGEGFVLEMGRLLKRRGARSCTVAVTPKAPGLYPPPSTTHRVIGWDRVGGTIAHDRPSEGIDPGSCGRRVRPLSITPGIDPKNG